MSNLKSTAATRVVTEDFEVPEKIERLDAELNAFVAASAARLEAQQAYDDAKRKAQDYEDVYLTQYIDKFIENNQKVPQAAIDREAKRWRATDKRLDDLNNEVFNAKQELDRATHEYEMARYSHRTLVAQLSAAAASLNFMGHSKAARSTALSILGDL